MAEGRNENERLLAIFVQLWAFHRLKLLIGQILLILLLSRVRKYFERLELYKQSVLLCQFSFSSSQPVKLCTSAVPFICMKRALKRLLNGIFRLLGTVDGSFCWPCFCLDWTKATDQYYLTGFLSVKCFETWKICRLHLSSG